MITTNLPLPPVTWLSEDQKMKIKTLLWEMDLSPLDPEEQDDSRVQEILDLISMVLPIL